MKKAGSLTSSGIPDIVARVQQGRDAEAHFRILFETFYRPLFNFFKKRNFSIDESHDLTQETFVRVYNNIGSFRGEAPFEAWLFQIAANIYRNTVRHQATQKRAGQHLSLVEATRRDNAAHAKGENVLADESAHNPLEDVLKGERLRLLRESIESLPEQMRRCVMLRVYQDLSYAEVATVMRISVETVKSHLHQARQQLKVKLSDYFDVPEF